MSIPVLMSALSPSSWKGFNCLVAQPATYLIHTLTVAFFALCSLFIAIVERGVKLRLNIVDTPGYGDQVNNENW